MNEPTVLAVDDSAAIRRILQTHLATLNVRVLTADSAEAALYLMRERPVDLVLLDVDMPGLSGFDLLAILRSDPEFARTSAMFLTARSSVSDLVEGLSLGACDYVRKPWEPDELRARVQVALRMQADRDELEARNRELDRLSGSDALTGLRNRRGFEQDLDRLRVRLRGEPVAVLAIDIDHFKRVNDQHGHAAGDSVLQTVAERLSAAVTARHLLARIGGEEFVVVAQGSNEATGTGLAERLRTVVGYAPVTLLTGESIEITVSVGVSSGTLSDEKLVEAADIALYHAKDSGRNRVVAASSLTTKTEFSLPGALS